MLLEKLFSRDPIENDKRLILDGYQKDKEEIERQLIPPVDTKIHISTIAKVEKWSKKLRKAGLKDQAEEAHGLALQGCAAFWINLLRNYSPDFDGEKVLLEVLEMDKKSEAEKKKR